MSDPPLERYLRCTYRLCYGTVEVGSFYAPGEHLAMHRRLLLSIGENIADMYGAARLDVEDRAPEEADRITHAIDARLVEVFGPRHPRFIEVWRGFGDDQDSVSQVYKPMGTPITAP
jgi:hypothetical protein